MVDPGNDRLDAFLSKLFRHLRLVKPVGAPTFHKAVDI
jgi:hypothetical protein